MAEGRYFHFELHLFFNAVGRCPYAVSFVLPAEALAFLDLPQRFIVRTAPSTTRGLTSRISHEGVHPEQLRKPVSVAAESYAVPDEQRFLRG